MVSCSISNNVAAINDGAGVLCSSSACGFADAGSKAAVLGHDESRASDIAKANVAEGAEANCWDSQSM